MFLPQSFPIVNTRLVIAQWKQHCPHVAQCSDDSPVIAVRYIGGKLHVTINTDSGQKTLMKQRMKYGIDGWTSNFRYSFHDKMMEKLKLS